MGMFTSPLQISTMDGHEAVELEATVDTGAMFTVVPARLLHGMGIEAVGRRAFELADGRRREMDYGEARAMINDDSVTTIVVFGEDAGPALLGAYTLEGLHLSVDPVQQRLVPTRYIMDWRIRAARPANGEIRPQSESN